MAKRTRKICPTHDVQLNRKQTRYGGRWECPVDGCTVCCWEGSTSTPADDETRAARHEMHKLFDPLWKDEHGPFCKGFRKNSKGVRRHRAYRWLAEQMGIDIQDAHFGMFTKEQCEQARQHVESLMAKEVA